MFVFQIISCLSFLVFKLTAGTSFGTASFTSQAAYREALNTATPNFPSGFDFATAPIEFVPKESPTLGQMKMNVALLSFPPTTSYSIYLTKNVLCGAPISYIKQNILKTRPPVHSILINNKISNVCTPTGVADAQALCELVEKSRDANSGKTLPQSTGVIGWSLPVSEMTKAIPHLTSKPKEGTGDRSTPLDFATAIMTTDRFPKLRSTTINDSIIMGCAKGAGMIEPNLGTMLSYVIMDLNIPKADFQKLTDDVIEQTFNCISVDGDESTSDTVVILSSNTGRVPSKSEYPAIKTALTDICATLSEDIVRNGEGTSHVIAVSIKNYPGSDPNAVGKKIVNSPLLKTAIAGNDPNIGRLASAIGSYMGKHESGLEGWRDKLVITVGNEVVFKNGSFVIEAGMEEKLSDYIKECQFGESTNYPETDKSVEIVVDFGVEGGKSGKVFGSDLTKEYVKVNADYRS